MITWNASTLSRIPNSHILGFINSRSSKDKIQATLRALYYYRPEELVGNLLASRLSDPPNAFKTLPNASYRFGDNPWIQATLISNLKYQRVDNETEILEWEQVMALPMKFPAYKIQPDQNVYRLAHKVLPSKSHYYKDQIEKRC